MAEEIVSSTMTKTVASDSNSSNSQPERPNSGNRPNKKCGGSSKFKGVVSQQNGHWGAQIYADHRRIWLGTFKTEAAAAAAYDSAAIKFRPGSSADAQRNFPWTALSMYEPNFQAHYEIDQVLNMIKDGSYQTKFWEYLSSISQVGHAQTNIHNVNQNKQEGCFCEELFRKELTPSDVGKLNRLVIPKRYALKYFPIKDNVGRKYGSCEGQEPGDQGGDMELVFRDNTMTKWTFRYCYWKSSQSFVFTRGWNKFVKMKELVAKDIVTFYKCEFRTSDAEYVEKIWMIDIVKYNATDEPPTNDDTLALRKAVATKKDKGFRLFGVQFVPANCDQDI